MNFDDFYQLGHVSKTYGLVGGIIIVLDVSDPSQYSNLDLIYVREQDQLVPHFIETIKISSSKARITLEDFASKDDADSLVGKEIYLPIKYLPKLGKGEYYHHDLIGFEVIENNRVLGAVEKIYDLGTQNLISVTIDGIEVMIPLNRDIIKEVDLENGKIVVELPEGLIDIYTKS